MGRGKLKGPYEKYRLCILCFQALETAGKLERQQCSAEYETPGRWRFMPLSEMGELFTDKSRRGGAECPEKFPNNTTLNSQKGKTAKSFAPAARVSSRIR